MNISIRPWMEEDANALYHMSMHPFYVKKRIWKYLYPDSFPHALATIHFYQQADSSKFLYRAILCDHQVCGYVQCEKTANDKAEISYWLDVQFWHMGIMKEAIHSICVQVFSMFDILQIYARVEKKNMDSQHVLEACGFHKEECQNLLIYRIYR